MTEEKIDTSISAKIFTSASFLVSMVPIIGGIHLLTIYQKIPISIFITLGTSYVLLAVGLQEFYRALHKMFEILKEQKKRRNKK